MKGRKMIFNLDRIGDTSLADSVMDCAEPPAGICTCKYAHTCIYICTHVYIYMYMSK